MVMERIAAAPIDQPRIRQRHFLPVVINRTAGVQQHVGDTRHRDEPVHRVAA